MSDTTQNEREPFITLKNGPLDGARIPESAKDSIVDGTYVGPGPYYPSYRVKVGSVPLIAEFEGCFR